MRIIINLHGFSPGSGGVETYLVNLVSALQRQDQVNEYALFGDRRMAEIFPLFSSNFQFVEKNYSGKGVHGLLRAAGSRLLHRDILAHHLRSWNCDLIHHPLTILNPPGLQIPGVLTFHDMQQEIYPEFFSSRELHQRSVRYRASVNEAKAVIAISSHVKKCLVERYGAQPSKIHVIHHGVHPSFCRVTDESHLQKLKLKYSLDRPFAIYPAATWHHKNHLRLLKAFRLLIDRNEFDGELVLTGAARQGEEAVRETIVDLNLGNHVRRLGYIHDADMPGLFTLSRMLVFPSLFEGFGLPVIEAMACGCPVACTYSSSLPEVAGDAAVYFDPESVESIAQKVAQVWNSARLGEELSAQGLLHAKRFSWETAALQTVAVYQEAVS